MIRMIMLFSAWLLLWAGTVSGQETASGDKPFLVVLGIAQDGGVPQAGTKEHPGWSDARRRRRVVCLGLIDPVSQQRWLFEATPDFREQLHLLDQLLPVSGKPGLSGIFVTHAHIGHYTGLMFLGHESLGAKAVPVYALPGMAEYLRSNGPWSQLVRYENIELRPLASGETVRLTEDLEVEPLLVPHRQEYSEVAGFVITGRNQAVLFIPDIDSWETWDGWGTRIEDVLARVDVAYLDATFLANGEIPGRDMSDFPHPFIRHSMARFKSLPDSEKGKIRFIHLNHTNPALWPGSDARREILKQGFRVAEELERVTL